MAPPSAHRALVVGDDPVIREIRRLHLELAGFALEEAADGRQALERIRATLFDPVLLDLMGGQKMRKFVLALLIATSSVAAQQDDDALVGRLLTALKSNPSDESTRIALRTLVSRHPPASRELDARIRDAFRESARAAVETLDPPGEPGEIMHVVGRVTDANGRPVDGALVYVFHADATGWYSRQGEMDERHPRLYAYIRTGPDGRYAFRTARPGGYQKTYQGRYIPQHIHFEVSARGLAERRFQLVFADDPRMDDYWREWARKQSYPVVPVARRGNMLHCVVDITLS